MKKRVHCFICKAVVRLFGCDQITSATAMPPQPKYPEYGAMTSEELTLMSGPYKSRAHLIRLGRSNLNLPQTEGPRRLDLTAEEFEQLRARLQPTVSAPSTLKRSRQCFLCKWLLEKLPHNALCDPLLLRTRGAHSGSYSDQEAVNAGREEYEKTPRYAGDIALQVQQAVRGQEACNSPELRDVPPYSGDRS